MIPIDSIAKVEWLLSDYRESQALIKTDRPRRLGPGLKPDDVGATFFGRIPTLIHQRRAHSSALSLGVNIEPHDLDCMPALNPCRDFVRRCHVRVPDWGAIRVLRHKD